MRMDEGGREREKIDTYVSARTVNCHVMLNVCRKYIKKKRQWIENAVFDSDLSIAP